MLPIVHVLFSNVKTWLNGTFHGVSAKHLPRYAREWSYRFNRRRRIADLTDFLLRRAATRPTITYRQLADGAQINGALPALTGEGGKLDGVQLDWEIISDERKFARIARWCSRDPERANETGEDEGRQ